MGEDKDGKTPRDLERLRKAIAEVDRSIVALLAERIHLSEEVARVKSDAGLPLRDTPVEEEVVRRMEEACLSRSLDPDLGRKIARLVIMHSLEIQKIVAGRKDEKL